jgi:hypothetical protein
MEEDPKVTRLNTVDDCKQFIINVQTEHPELAKQARRRAIVLRARDFGATDDVEREALQCVYALEEAKTTSFRRYRANRTWGAIARSGIITTVNNIVSKTTDSLGYEALTNAGLAEFTFENVVLRHPERFAETAVAMARIRLGSQLE